MTGVTDDASLGASRNGDAELESAEVPLDLKYAIEAMVARYPEPHSAVLPALHLVQEYYGRVTARALTDVASVLKTTPAYIASVATFYDMFATDPDTGKHRIMVCTNIACTVNGAESLYEGFLTAVEADDRGCSADGAFQIDRFECMGACEMAPMASLDGHYRGPILPEEIPAALEQLRKGEDPLPMKRSGSRKAVEG